MEKLQHALTDALAEVRQMQLYGSFKQYLGALRNYERLVHQIESLRGAR